MNIFKVLASGHGSIKETNVSAFLAYLLNPRADHGLESHFLRALLTPFIDKMAQEESNDCPILPIVSKVDRNKQVTEDSNILDLSIYSKFNVEVVMEKAMREKNEEGKYSSQIIDIIIKISQQNKQTNQDIGYLFAKETPIAILLIENKINLGSYKQGQLQAQYRATLKHLPTLMQKKDWNLWKDKICTILIAPHSKSIADDVEKFKKKRNSNTLYFAWHNEGVLTNYADGNICSILNSCLQDSVVGKNAPINGYVGDTIRALIDFCFNEFSSDADDQQKGGRTSQPVYYPTLNDLWASGNCKLKPEVFGKIQDINTHINSAHPQGNFTKTHLLRFFRADGKTKKFSISSRGRSAVILVPRVNQNISAGMKKLKFALRPKKNNEFLIDNKSVNEIKKAIDFLAATIK